MDKSILELTDKFLLLNEQFQSGSMDKYQFVAEKYKFHHLLTAYASEIKNSPIESITIHSDGIIFTFKGPIKIMLESDGGSRAAPLEILNLGNYEIEDESMAYQLIQDGDTLLDIGAHIGWYTINFAKRFPKSPIHSFEPLEETFSILNKNVKRNGVNNVTLHKCGLSNKVHDDFLYYFKEGSALTSIANLIDHPAAQKKRCTFKTIDKIAHDLNLQSVDFIKCDAEGSELFIFEGGEETIHKYRPIIFTELYEKWCIKCGYSTGDVLRLLSSWGYEPFQSVNGKLVKTKDDKLDNDDRYNYFFLDPVKHARFIKPG